MQPSYDVLWRGYWGDMQRLGPVHRHIREDIVRRVGGLEVKSVLDVGCGSGENLAALASLGRYDLSGVDISPEGIELARKRVPGARMLSVLNSPKFSAPLAWVASGLRRLSGAADVFATDRPFSPLRVG